MRLFFTYVVWVLAILAGAVQGAEPTSNTTSPDEPSGGLTLARAVEAALARNPALAASAYEVSAAEARIEQARLRRNPELSVELENFAGSGVAQSTDALESTLSLAQVIELGGKRALRTEVAARDLDRVSVECQAAQLDVLAEVTRRFIDVVAAEQRAALATTTKDAVARTLDAIETRVEAARSPEAERSRARIAFTRAVVEERQAQSELNSARVALAAAWGSIEPRFTSAEADLLVMEPVESFENLVERVEQNPDFLHFASEARLREAELRLARAQARANLTFSAGLRRLHETNDTALVAGFSMALPVFDRNQGAIREAEVRVAQNDATHRAAFVRARATLFALYQELVALRGRLEILREDALPQADMGLQQTRIGYDRGRFSYLELATAQREVLELRAAIIDAAADAHRVRAEIERLTSAPVARTP